jgi:hypothetical protein
VLFNTPERVFQEIEMEMNNVVIDADFVQKVIKGSANIDRMRQEIRLVMGMVLEALPRKTIGRIVYPCPIIDNLRSMGWVILTKFTEVGSDFRDDYPGYKGHELWVAYRIIGKDGSVDEVVFGHQHNSDFPKFPIPQLEYVSMLHGDLPILLKGIVENYPECAVLKKNLLLLVAEA